MSKITHYTDFLSDKQFIRWQLTPDDLSNDYWQNFIVQNPHLESELHKAANYLKKRGLNKTLLSEADRDNLLNEIQKTISQNRSKIKKKRVISIIGTSVAAILIIALGINIYFNTQKDIRYESGSEVIVGNALKSEDIRLISGNKTISFQENIDISVAGDGKAQVKKESDKESHENVDVDQKAFNKLVVPYGKRTTLTLTDGSKLWLNSGSVLEFPAQFHGKNREIHLLSGELYIEVSSDKHKPFLVHARDFNVKVHGTAFNLSAYTDSPHAVVLVEGSVSLKSADNKELFINPNEQAVFSDNGNFDTRVVDVAHFTSWRKGHLEFDKTPMTEVLLQIGRYYNLSFDYAQDVNLSKRTCTGKISLSENLDHVMKTIGLLTNSKYMKENNQIYLINNNE